MKGIWHAVFLAGLMGLSGCAGVTPPFEKQAFGSEKVYAVVSIYADKDIEKEGDSETLVGTYKAITGKAAYYHSAEEALNASAPRIRRELASSSHYRLVPERRVLSDAAYRRVEPDVQAKLAEKRHLVSGYKYIWDPQKLGQLARDLRVDGVITVHVQYGYKFWGTNYAKVTAKGKTSPVIRMTARFYDENGQPVWNYSTKKYLVEGVPSMGDAADMKQLQPLMVKASGLTAQAIVAGLDRRMK